MSAKQNWHLRASRTTRGGCAASIREILAALESVGETKCICRNEYAVHEQVGAFTNQHLNGHAGLILNPRAGFTSVSQSMGQCFHIKENTARGERQSIQFFDHQAMHY
ncbi:hypothetical protein DMI62_01005 [Escherichia coli]|nr:hypothetical protein [Escherichia coli]